MFKWPKRTSEAERTKEQLPDGEIPSALEFVVRNETAITESRHHWQHAAARIKPLKDEKYAAPFRNGVQEVYENSAITPDAQYIDRASETALDNLSVLMLVKARVQASESMSIMAETTKAVGFIRQLPHPNINFIIGRKEFPTQRYAQNYINIVLAMREADASAAAVLGNLTQTYASNPSGVMEFGQLYQDQVDEIDPRFAELKKIITTDWHHPDPDSSILQRFVHNIKESPELHRRGFIDTVLTNEQYKKYATIHNMAKFSLYSQGVSRPGAHEVAAELGKTYSIWEDIDDIQQPFSAYVASVGSDLERTFASIAGPKDTNYIRMHRTEEEVERYAQNVAIYEYVGRTDARKDKRDRAKQTNLVHTASISAEIARTAEEEELTERPIVTVKAANGKPAQLIPCDLEEVVDRFKLSNEHQLHDDMRQVVSYLQRASGIDKLGVARLAERSLTISNKKHGLWRFAPDKCANVTVDPRNRFYRIVYTVIDNQLVIYDILDHDSFTKKY